MSYTEYRKEEYRKSIERPRPLIKTDYNAKNLNFNVTSVRDSYKRSTEFKKPVVDAYSIVNKYKGMSYNETKTRHEEINRLLEEQQQLKSDYNSKSINKSATVYNEMNYNPRISSPGIKSNLNTHYAGKIGEYNLNKTNVVNNRQLEGLGDLSYQNHTEEQLPRSKILLQEHHNLYGNIERKTSQEFLVNKKKESVDSRIQKPYVQSFGNTNLEEENKYLKENLERVLNENVELKRKLSKYEKERVQNTSDRKESARFNEQLEFQHEAKQYQSAQVIPQNNYEEYVPYKGKKGFWC